jgi:hypothetical protein
MEIHALMLKPALPTKTLCALLITLILPLTAHATVYDVGPTYPKTMLKDVPWATLQPGDVVNIHTKPGGYHEKIQVSESGTSAQHIVIHGVPDPVTGALPILDAKDAIEDPSVDWRNQVFSPLGLIVVSPRATAYSGKYGTYHTSFVDIENLDLRNALWVGDGSITYTDQYGAVRGYDSFACGLYIEWAHDLAVRGCELSNCCNGLFANSKNGTAQSSARLLIEGNYFHDNSLPYTVDPTNPAKIISNGYHEHHCYIESAGVTYQYNRFGQLHAGAHGVAIKDRSSGQVIRYNEFDMNEESNVLALLDPQGGAGYINLQPDFQESYVYGNLITIENYASGISAIWWGSFDGGSVYAANHRGVLHFFNNTIVNHHKALALFFLPNTGYSGGTTVLESVDCRNNVFFSDTSQQSGIYSTMYFSTAGATNGGGNINLGVNWISPGWLKDSPGHAYEGALNGTANLIVGNGMGANSPLFVDINAYDYHVLTGSNIIDASGATGAGDPAVMLEYVSPQTFQTRPTIGPSLDLGALESTGAPPPPPAGGALQFSAAAYSVAENVSGGLIAISVTRTGGSTGAVSVAYNASGGTATAGSDFIATGGILNWPAGDTAPRSFNVIIINDSSPENAETIQLTLTNISGGAGYGAPSAATLTITDDDIPPSQPIVAVTGSGKLIRFTTGTPGTIISNVTVSGIDAAQTLRGLAFRRSTGQLYVVGAVGGAGPVASSLYLLNPSTGVVTKIADITSTLLAHPSFDLGIDPSTDQLHIYGSTGQHLRLSPNTGAILGVDTPLAFAAGDAHFGAAPGIVGADFTPGLAPTVYGIDKTIDSLVRIGSVGGFPLSSSSGQITTIGALGLDTEGLTGLDFSPAGVGYAVLNPATGSSSNLYVIDTLNGHATSLGQIGVAEQVRDLVVATPGDLSLISGAYTVTEGDGSATIGIARTGGSWGVVSVDFSTSNGTASSGSDYTAVTQTITWLDGEVGVKTLSIPIVSDNVVEGSETVNLTLSNVTGGALLLLPSTSLLTILEPPYQNWKNLNFGVQANNPLVAGDAASPAGDGVPNLLKYAAGLYPFARSTTAPPMVSFNGGMLQFTFQRDPGATDATLTVDASSDLSQWFAGSQYGKLGDIPTNATSTQISRVIDPATGLETITVRSNLTTPTAGFMRLRVSQP